jgi:hypothetical protein
LYWNQGRGQSFFDGNGGKISEAKEGIQKSFGRVKGHPSLPHP